MAFRDLGLSAVAWSCHGLFDMVEIWDWLKMGGNLSVGGDALICGDLLVHGMINGVTVADLVTGAAYPSFGVMYDGYGRSRQAVKPMDELGINVVLGASQKGLMCPPGLGFAAVDAAAMAVCERNPMPRFYWDWRLRKSDLSYRKFCGTPPQNLLRGLEAALALIFDEGVDNVLARHDLMARTVRAAVQSWSEAGALQFFGRVPESRSSSVTTILVGAGVDPEAMRTVAREPQADSEQPRRLPHWRQCDGRRSASSARGRLRSAERPLRSPRARQRLRARAPPP